MWIFCDYHSVVYYRKSQPYHTSFMTILKPAVASRPMLHAMVRPLAMIGCACPDLSWPTRWWHHGAIWQKTHTVANCLSSVTIYDSCITILCSFQTALLYKWFNLTLLRDGFIKRDTPKTFCIGQFCISAVWQYTQHCVFSSKKTTLEANFIAPVSICFFITFRILVVH